MAIEGCFYIADRTTGTPWKIGVTWPFSIACERLARAQRSRPGIDWVIRRADGTTAQQQIWEGQR